VKEFHIDFVFYLGAASFSWDASAMVGRQNEHSSRHEKSRMRGLILDWIKSEQELKTDYECVYCTEVGEDSI
jgi:hypothetical protein